MLFKFCIQFCTIAIFLLTQGCPSDAAGESGDFEIDLLFPRNDTYAPVPVMPVVLGVQNFPLTFTLDPRIVWWFASPGGDDGDRIYTSATSANHIELVYVGENAGNPYLATFWTDAFMQGQEGSWEFWVKVSIASCSNSTSEPSHHEYNKTVIFTTKNGAPAPDLVAATSGGDTCTPTESFVFNVTETIPNNDHFFLQPSCAVLGTGPSPTASPCAVKINASAASSIVAEATHLYCVAANDSSAPGYNATFPCPGRRSAAVSLARQNVGMQVTWWSTILTVLLMQKLV